MKEIRIRKSTPLIFTMALLALMVNLVFSRTRQEVIENAGIYANYEWRPSVVNILDVKDHINNFMEPDENQIAGSDGRDDRAFKWDLKADPPIWVYSTANWPFAVGVKTPGEAYAYGEWDTTTTFTTKLASTVGKYIAGNVSSDLLLPTGYEGFAGTDCSGFVARILGITTNKPDTGGLLKYSLSTTNRTTDLKPGDVLDKPRTDIASGHVVVFVEWEDYPVTARIIHAAPWSYFEGRLAANIHFDRATLSGDVRIPGTIDVRYTNGYDARSLFPQFTWTNPVKVDPAKDQLPMFDPLGPAVELTIKTGSSVKVRKSSIKLVIDEDLATEVRIANSAQELTFSPGGDSPEIAVSFAIPASVMLAPGNHKIKVYATNTLDLEDSDELYFTVPVPPAPGIRWTDYFNLNAVSGDMRGYLPGVENAPWLHSGIGSLQLTGRAALKDFRIYNNDTMGSVVYGKDFIAGANTAVIGNALDTVPSKLGYYAVLTDQLDNSSVMHFHLDKNGPTIDPAAKAMVNAAGDGFTFTVSGTEMDAVSGIGLPVEMRDGIGGVVSSIYTGPGYPAGPPSAAFSFADISSDKKFIFFDRAGWLGTYDLGVNHLTSGLNVSNSNYPAPAVSQVYGDSGVILRSAAISVGGVSLQPGPHIHLLDQPQGMKVELLAYSANDASTANLPVTYGFTPVGSQTLFTLTGPGSDTGIFNIPMYRLGGIKLVTTPNTNVIRYLEDIDTNSDGVYDATREGAFEPGLFYLRADATANTAYSNLYGLEHFYKDIDLGPVRSAQSGNVSAEIRNVTKGGNVTIESARYTLKQPGYKMANSNTIYEIKTTAVYGGPIYLKIGFCEAGHTGNQRAAPKIFHCDAGMDCTPIADSHLDGECTAAATVNSLSPFGVMVPIDDITSPHTVTELIGTNKLVGVDLWVTTETYINLNSNDNANIGDISGVATTYYLLDAAPTPECLAAPHNPQAAYGSCANSRYNGAFTLSEGSHTINYLSADNWGNKEQPISKSLFVDGTSPRTSFTAKGVEAQAGETVNIIWTDSITLTAVDPISGGVASGFNRTQYLIDTDPVSCGGVEMDPAAPEGTCQYEPYNGPFTLPAGLHSLYFRSIDNVENIEPFKKIDVNCAGDVTPPVVTLSLNGVDVSTFTTVNALTVDSITITAVDPAVGGFISGVKAVYYLINVTTASCQTPPDLIGPAGTCRNPVYTGPFTLAVGTHTIYYTAEDNAGNIAAGKSAVIKVIPPVVLTSVTLNTSFVFLQVGSTQQFSAMGMFSDGASRALTAFDGPLWSVAHGTVAVISPTGLVKGAAYGKTQVRVSFGSLSAESFLFVYEPLPPSFTATGSMTVPRHTHTATLLPDGNVLVAGGNNGAQILSSAEIYYPKTGEFKITGYMNATRGRGHTETLLPDGTVLLTGGISGNSIVATAEVYNPTNGTFSTKSRMAIERYSHSATLLANGKVLITGGASETGTVSLAELYDPSNGTFSPAGSLAYARYYHTATLLPDGKVLVAGGLTGLGTGYTSKAEIYDPVNKTFSPTGSLNMARAFAKAVLLWNGEVLLAGGSNSNSSNVLAAETYSPGSGSFTTAGSLSIGRKVGHTATLLPDGRVLVAGGDVYGNNNPVSVAEIYDPVTRKFGATVPMNSGRFFHAAALLLPNGRVLVCGGNNAVSSLNTAELYNLGFGVPSTLESITVIPSSATIEVDGTKQFTATGNFSDGSSRPLGAGLAWSVVPATVAVISNNGLVTGTGLGKARITVSSGSVSAEAVLTVSPPEPKFIATGSMTVPRHTHTATLLPNGNVLVAGGNNGAQILSSAEIYYPATKEFKITGSMGATRGRGHTETLLPDGTVLLTGGISGNSIVATAEIYNPTKETFSPAGSMAEARYSHSATLLANGKVLITGGAGDNGTVSLAELYDPSKGTFSPAGSLALGRYYHTATLLPDGKVLVAGGLAGLGTGYTSSAEVYDPVKKTFSSVTPMNTARAFAKAVLLRTGEVLLAGGSSSNSSNVLAAETYNPGSRSFSTAGSLSVGRKVGHTVTLLPDGKALVAGGDVYGNNNPVSLAEIYDPVFRTFSVTAPMSSGRFFHAAALLLPNGKVLVCGGNNASTSLTTAELFDSGFRGTLSPMLTSLLVEPSTASLAAGSALQFTAFGNFSDGSSRALSAADGLDWSVDHDSVAFISEGGLVTGTAFGKTIVRASSGIYSSEAGLSVFYPPGVSADGLVSVNAPDAGLSVTAVSTDTIASTSTIFAAMSVAGLKPAMGAFYDFQPSGVQFAAPAKLRFIFDPALVEPAAVAIYYFDGVTWSSASIANQTTGLLAGGQAYVEGYINHSSIYAALYFKDILPPVTGLAFSGPNFGAKPVYVSSFTTLSLTTYDDAVTVGDRLGGVAARYYSVDSAAFTLYSGTFSIAGEGSHVVGYYSVDTAGNREEPRSTEVSVDVTPAVSAVSLDGTAGQKGWFISPVAVTLTSTDSLSGVAAAYYAQGDAPFALYGSSFGVTAEGVHSLRHYAIDNIGNREAEKAISFGIDTSTPVITFARTPGHNATGWNNSPVSVVFSGTDAVSGIAYCSPAIVLETEGFGQPVSGYCADYAGWSSTATLTLNIDRTAPALTISSPAAGNIFIATKDRIGVFFTAADNLDPSPKASARLMQVEDKGSPRGDRPSVIAVTYGQLIEPLDIDDGIWRLIASATDFADNTSTLSGGTFEVVHDVLAPRTGQTIAGGASLTDGATTYLTGETVLKFSSVDDLVVAEDGIGLGVKKQVVRFKAEGLVVKELAFENPEPKQGGVFNSTFTLASTLGLADGLYSLAYYAEDILGNIEAERTLLIGLDNASPVTAAELAGTPGENGWYISAVSVKLTANDAISEVAGIYYQSEFNGQRSEPRSFTGPFTVSAEGLYNVYFYSKDRLGNTEAEKTIAFKIDSTNPLISAERTPLANAHGWNNTPVTTVFRGTDAISGVSYCSPAVVLEIEGFGQPVSGYCADYAGRSSSVTLTINMDRTAPGITISSPAAGNIFIATKDRIGVFFTAADNLDPSPKTSARLMQVEDKGSPRGGRPSVIAVAYGQLIEPLDIDDGIWRLAVSATDFAYNTSTLSGGAFEVVHDVLAPRTGQTMANGASLTDGATTYITGGTVLKFSSVDDLVVAEDGIGLGVKKQIVRLKTGGLVVKELAFENPEPKQGVVFNSTFTLATASGLADGPYSLAYYAEDILGNIEAEKIFTLGLDNTAPVTTAELTGTSGENGWHISAVSVKLTASDALSDVAGIYYQSEFNGQKSELRSYTGPFTVSVEGLYNVYFYAKDRLGNTEAEKTIAFKIDRTDPLISAERTPLANTYGWNNTAVTVNYLCTDGLSGVKSCPPAVVLAGEGINQSASGEAIDHAGNRSSVTVSGINIDKTAPASAYRVEGIIYNAGDRKTYLSPTSKLSLSAANPVSGGAASDIDAVEYYIDSAPFIVYTSSFSLNEGIRSVYYRSRDKAGNEEAARSTELHIDGTSPVTSFNISGTPYIVDGTHYINSQSAISFAAADPLTEGVASGVLITKYRLDGGAWQIYVASITIPAEGLHKLEYYSLDKVQNAEALWTLTIVVDNTAPAATLSVGEPIFEVFGLKIMTPETPVTLTAEDPESDGPASGVKSIYYELTDASGQGSGVRNYTEPFNTGREGIFTVSYWSVDNAGNSGTPLEAKLRVSSLRSDALDAVDGLEMTGSTDIAGTVRSNATVSLAGNARILGDVYASTISISGKAQLTGQQHSGAATLIPTPLYMPEIVEIASNTNNNSLVPAKYLVNGRLVVPAKDELTLSTGVYYFNGIDLGGRAKVGVNGKVDILVAGDISINGGATLNAAGSSSRLNIFLSTSSALTFTGGGSLAAYVYAPYSQLKLAGNALLGGHYFVKRAIISGAGNILQAGEALPVAVAPPGGGPKTKASAMVTGAYSVLAGPDPAFKLGEVYVFPNPAKGGEAPVFHVETGIADSVKITIYTISGRAAHEQTLTGMPVELDDGNGLSYAYEYVWRGHIPSGIYLYYIETQKAGQKLKKTGKFSVVR